MTNTMSLISILRDHPLIGFLIGLGFVFFMFMAKNLIIYFYSNHKPRQ